MSELFCAVLCPAVVHNDTHTHEQFLKFTIGFSLDSGFLFVYFCHLVLVLFAFGVLRLVSLVLTKQRDGWEEGLQNDLYFVSSGTEKP